MSDDSTLIIILVFIAFAYFWWIKKPDGDGRLSDKAVNINVVETIIINDFELKKHENLKYGYTEKTIEKQLLGIFQEKIQHVVSQYGLDGQSGQKIDFDIGHGKVGVEIKLANAVFKAAGQDRMVGQVQSYIQSKYNDRNLLLVIICEAKHIAERAVVKKITDRLADMKVQVLFLEVE